MNTAVRCTVESMAYSACGMVPGDAFEVDRDGMLTIPNGRPFCYFAIAQVVPYLQDALDPPRLIACPDPPEALWMRVERFDPDAHAHITNGTPPDPTEEPTR